MLVLDIPKRLRLHARFDRKLLGKLSSCAWTCIQAEVRRLLGRDDVLPGMVAAILPGRARAMVREWTGLHRAELEEDWRLRRLMKPLNKIEGLE